MHERHFKLLVAISSLSLVLAAYLVYLNVKSPGFCPPYPIIGAPACIVMGSYLVLILGSLFVKARWGDTLFYVVTTVALVSAIVISTKQSLGLADCPRLFDIPIPLCFPTVLTMALLLFLKYHGRSRQPAL